MEVVTRWCNINHYSVFYFSKDLTAKKKKNPVHYVHKALEL